MTPLLAAFFYGFFSLDHFAVGPFLLSRPLVMGTLAGLLFGHVPEGLALGVLGESLWVVVPPSGAAQWDVGLVTILASVWAFTSPVHPASTVIPGYALAVYFLMAIPFAVMGRRVDQWMRRHLKILADQARAGITQGVSSLMWSNLLFSLALWVLKSMVVFFVAEAIGGALCQLLLPEIQGPVAEGLDRAWRLWPALGAATLWHLFTSRIGAHRKLGFSRNFV